MTRETRICVTGGAGFIGSHLIDQMIKQNRAESVEIFAIDNLSLGKKLNLEAALTSGIVKFQQIDCTDRSALREFFRSSGKFDWVVHCAVEPLPHSLKDPVGSFRRNVLMVENICELQHQGAFSKLLSFSSSEVYGTALTQEMTETHPLEPHTTYAASKSSGDLLIQSFVKCFQTQAIILRPFNNYGPRQNSGDFSGIIPHTLKNLAHGLPPLISGTGEQTRDFSYVEDTAKAALALMGDIPLDGRVYNFAAGQEVSMNEIISTLCRLWNYQGAVTRVPERPGDLMRHCGNMDRFLKDIHTQIPKTPLKEGLAMTVKWYQSQFQKGFA